MLVTVIDGNLPGSNAFALIISVVSKTMGFVYSVEYSVGMEASVVYLISAPDDDDISTC